ncbi:Protein kinase domain-containing protein [Abeliophyllum distichum]|uniref:Protein kinase domain-containing protein n=1 Tax=Abeliophyllum distichum TaxID=126358 RepID=A0ABD1Q628_9LAMI
MELNYCTYEETCALMYHSTSGGQLVDIVGGSSPGAAVCKDNEMVLKTFKFLKDSVDDHNHIVSHMINLFLVEDTANLSREELLMKKIDNFKVELENEKKNKNFELELEMEILKLQLSDE